MGQERQGGADSLFVGIMECFPGDASCQEGNMVTRKGIPAETARVKAQGQKTVPLSWGVLWPGLYFKDVPLAVKKRLDGGKGGAERRDTLCTGTGLGRWSRD